MLFKQNKFFGVCSDDGTIIKYPLDSLWENEFGIFAVENEKIHALAPGNYQALSGKWDSVAYRKYGMLCYEGDRVGLYQQGLEIPPKYEFVGPYLNGYLYGKNGKIGFKNATLHFPCDHLHIYMENERILCLEKHNGKEYYDLLYGYKLNAELSDSLIIYPHHYKVISGKSQKIYTQQQNELIAYSSEYDIYPINQTLSYTVEMAVAVNSSKKCAFFKGNTPISPFIFDHIFQSQRTFNEQCRVLKDSTVNISNYKGELVFDKGYSDIKTDLLYGKYYIVQNQNKVGVVDSHNKVYVPFNHSEILLPTPELAGVSNGSNYALFSIPKQRNISSYRYYTFRSYGHFMTAILSKNSCDLFFKDSLIISGIFDLHGDQKTMKGYKDGKIHIYYYRNDSLSYYSYDIPSYKLINENFTGNAITRTVGHRPSSQEMALNYSENNYNFYNFFEKKWENHPVKHVLYFAGEEYVVFDPAENIEMNGIEISSIRQLKHWFAPNQSLNPYNLALFNKLTIRENSLSGNMSIGISMNTFRQNNQYISSSERFEQFGSPVFSSRVFNGEILVTKGQESYGKFGLLSIQNYYNAFAYSGLIRPSGYSAYKELLNSKDYVRFTDAAYFFLDNSWGNDYISYKNAYEEIPLEQANYNGIVYKENGKFGFKPRLESPFIPPIFDTLTSINYTHLFAAGIAGKHFKLLNTKDLSVKNISFVHALDDSLVLCAYPNGMNYVLDINGAIIFNDTTPIKLMGNGFWKRIQQGKESLYYKKKRLLVWEKEIHQQLGTQFYELRTDTGWIYLNTALEQIASANKDCKASYFSNHLVLDESGIVRILDIHGNELLNEEPQDYHLGENFYRSHIGLKITFVNEVGELSNLKGHVFETLGNYFILKRGKNYRLYTLEGKSELSGTDYLSFMDAFYLKMKQGNKKYLIDIASKTKWEVSSFDYHFSDGNYVFMNLNIPVLIPFKAERKDIGIREDSYGKFHLELEDTALSYKYKILPIGENYLWQDTFDWGVYNSDKSGLINTYPAQKIYQMGFNLFGFYNGYDYRYYYETPEGEWELMEPSKRTEETLP